MAPDIRGFDDESMQRQDESIDDAIFHFDAKNVFSLKNNPMCGITFGQWLRVLHENGRFIEWKYAPRALFLTLTALFNSLLAIVESILYPDSRIAQVKLPDDPVFIVGHPRTGTTLMHNLLASDTATFYSCTTFCAGFPTCFLWFESWGKWLFAGILDKTRPMDSMALHFDLPQEDECATTILSAGASYYMPIYMMTREAQFRRFLDFSPEQGATPEDEARWTSSFLYLLRKLTMRKQLLKLGDRLLLKSPIHAARIPILRKLFPKARFIYMHRDPFETMASSAHLANTAFWFMYLSTPTDEQVTEYLFWNFRQLWLKYNAAAEVKSSSTSSRVVHEDILEMSYVDLITKPEESLRRVYTHAKVPWTEAKRAHFAAEMQALSSYKVNQHRVMVPAMRARIQKEAQQFMDAFGYH